MKKTNAARTLDKLKLSYTLHTYEVDENDLSASSVAKKCKQALEVVFKTIVCTGDTTPFLVACIPAHKELNLKALAKASKNKKCQLLPLKELLQTTGYIRGGCSPLAMKKTFATYIDESATKQQNIFISAGIRGAQLCVAPQDLQKASRAHFANLCD